MYRADVAIVGAGVAGSLAATMLGRAGYSVVLLEPVHPFPDDFRCEKIDYRHADSLAKAGVFDEVTPAGKRYDRIWLAREGRFIESRPLVEYGIDYAALVNRLRELMPTSVEFVHERVVGAKAGAGSRELTLSNGSKVEARLVVLANGLNPGLFEAFGLERKVMSSRHSVSIGFDVEPVGRKSFDFTSLTYYGEHPRHRVAYLTLFPIGDRVRANMFVYRDLTDPWFKELRADPTSTVFAALPRLKALTGDFRVLDTPKVRPVDLVNTLNFAQAGLVLVGDAFSSACPASGTGAGKAFVDVERLCNVHVPRWLADGGPVGVDRIDEFYSDPVKVESDRASREISLFAKRLALGSGLGWKAYRWARYFGPRARNALHNVRWMLASTEAKGWGH